MPKAWEEGCEVSVTWQELSRMAQGGVRWHDGLEHRCVELGDARVGVVHGELAARRMPRFVPRRKA